MRKVLTAILCLLAVPASAAEGLRGQWQVRSGSYTGIVLVDADGRATWDAPEDFGRPAKFLGYIARNDGVTAEIVFTDRKTVARIYCSIQSSEVLHCRARRPDAMSEPFQLVRIGVGPMKLTLASP